MFFLPTLHYENQLPPRAHLERLFKTRPLKRLQEEDHLFSFHGSKYIDLLDAIREQGCVVLTDVDPGNVRLPNVFDFKERARALLAHAPPSTTYHYDCQDSPRYW